MKTLFLEAAYKGKVELCKEVISYLTKNNVKSVALFASIQFVNNLSKVEEQLKELGIKVISSKPARAGVERQLLGCDVYADSLNLSEEVDAFLYIGDGKFHPLALVYSQIDKEVICNDPVNRKMSILDVEDVKKVMKRSKGALVKFHSFENIGVIVTIKPGQEQFRKSLELEKKYPEKKFYYFVDNNVSFDQLENFPFIDVWVNSACPRLGLDEQEMFRKGVVNLRDVF